jgi:hypothetical protein
MSNCKIEYSLDMNEVYITPNRSLPLQHFLFIVEFIGKIGFNYWLPGGPNGEYRFAKELRNDNAN